MEDLAYMRKVSISYIIHTSFTDTGDYMVGYANCR